MKIVVEYSFNGDYSYEIGWVMLAHKHISSTAGQVVNTMVSYEYLQSPLFQGVITISF